MTRVVAWVVGAGGLLGSATDRLLEREIPDATPWRPGPEKFPWTDRPELELRLGEAVRRFAEAAARADADWMVLWCAGAGVVGTPAAALAQESRTLRFLLDCLGEEMPERRGYLSLSSSAGGVYGGSPDPVLTEDSAPCPLSDYGRAKLEQEEILAAWSASRPRVSTFVARLSNLYGAGQNLAKPQGLISHLSRSLHHHAPVHVYAPLDTLRDQLFAPDAASRILRCMARLRASPAERRVTKIVASGQTVSIAGILAAFARVARRRPRIICSRSAAGRLQPARLAMRSKVWTDVPFAPATSLEAGIRSVYQHHLELFQQGRLPPP